MALDEVRKLMALIEAGLGAGPGVSLCYLSAEWMCGGLIAEQRVVLISGTEPRMALQS
jgi:hypothetical protein